MKRRPPRSARTRSTDGGSDRVEYETILTPRRSPVTSLGRTCAPEEKFTLTIIEPNPTDGRMTILSQEKDDVLMMPVRWLTKRSRRIIAQHRSDEASKRLRSIPGIGIVGATAIAATVRTRRFFDRVVTLQPGSGSYRGKFDWRQTQARAASPKSLPTLAFVLFTASPPLTGP